MLYKGTEGQNYYRLKKAIWRIFDSNRTALEWELARRNTGGLLLPEENTLYGIVSILINVFYTLESFKPICSNLIVRVATPIQIYVCNLLKLYINK